MELLSVFARHLELDDLSDGLFGEVSKSISSLGLASAPRIYGQLDVECTKRLENLHEKVSTSTSWLLDVLECVATAAEESRLRHSSVFSFSTTLEALWPPLAELIPTLEATKAAVCYRCLRQLPPSMVQTQGARKVHEELALRCMALATVEAFDYVQLTSVVYSQLCLYDLDSSSDSLSLQSSWKATWGAWQRASQPVEESEMPLRSRFQASVLAMSHAAPEASRLRPVALELQEALKALGHDSEGPFFQGPFEIHAQTHAVAFCRPAATSHSFYQESMIYNIISNRSY